MRAPSRRSIWLLSGLHLLLTLGTPVVLIFLMVGCMKAKAKRADLGPEIPSETINQVLQKATAKADLSTLAKGQYLDFSDTRRVENQDTAINLGGRRVEVIDRNDTTAQSRITSRITNSTRQADGSFQMVVTEDSLWLNKAATTAMIPPALRAVSSPVLTTQSLARAYAASSTAQRTTFHHLAESDAVLDAPAPVQTRVGCGGLNPCSLPVHVVQFDMVLWQDETNYQKISFDFAFSLKTPYIPFGSGFDQLTGVLIVDCRSTYIPVGSSNVYVRDCLTLDDFSK